MTCRAERISALTSFLKALPSADVVPAAVGTVIVDESLVKLIEEEVLQTTVSVVNSETNIALSHTHMHRVITILSSDSLPKGNFCTDHVRYCCL